ncbi:formate transporter FocA [Trueperella sp. LYQ141]|uniref:formate transporter FocA n=1 Tax=Trueperella sp. LYQ141 TaxID=3391058 RepID=UPI003982FDEE
MSLATPAQIVDAAEYGLLKKATTPFRTTLISAIFAGAFIALGFVFYTTSQMGAAQMPYGLAKIVGGLAFSTGLAMVIITGADLFTSTSMTLMLGVGGKLPWPRLIQHWGVVYVGNFIGALCVALIVFYSGTPHQGHGAWGAAALNTAISKVSHSPLESVLLGILCNFMVCMAVWLAFAGKTLADKILAITLPIALFVSAGFEHSIANMFMIPMGLLVKHAGADEVLTAAGNPAMGGLTIPDFLLHNLIPVTLGNILGGGIFVGLGMFFWHRRDREAPSNA